MKQIEYINGQLKAYEVVNGKINHGFEFYIRDMREPLYGGWDLSFDGSSLKTCFEKQQIELLKRYKKPVPDELGITYTESDFDSLAKKLSTWLFKFINDTPGHRLEDPAEAFSICESDFRDDVSRSLAESIQSATGATSILLADVPHEYFMGCRFLFDSPETFYELRIGYFF